MLKNIHLYRLNNFSRKFCAVTQEKIITKFLKEDSPPIEVLEVPYSKYGGSTTVTLITGADVGKQGAEYLKRIFEHTHAPINLEYLVTTDKKIVQNELLLSVMRNGTAIYIDDTHKPEFKQKSLLMNTQLDLYACVTNCFTIPGYGKKFPPSDITIISQNNRGDFSKLEYEPVKGVVETLKITERKNVERFTNFAFKYAKKHGRKKITFGHTSDELPLADNMCLEVAKKLHEKKYPNIWIETMLINQLTRNLIMNPSDFDVLCLDDRCGTVLTSLVSGICGGASLFSASDVGDHHTIFKPLQTKLSVTNYKALCPYGTVTTATNLLQYLGYRDCASNLWRGLMQVMLVDKIKTREFGGDCPEEEVICKLLDVLKESCCQHRK